MKKSIRYTIPIFLIIFLINPAFGFAGMTANESTAKPDPNNTTGSDKDIVLVQHLIEVDAVQLQSENKLLVKETLVFKNNGAKNFSGLLRTWVPDGAEIIWQKDNGEIVRQSVVQRMNMMDGRFEYPLQPTLKENIVSWTDIIDTKSLPPLYAMQYLLSAEPKGTLTQTKHYSKTLLYPTFSIKQPSIFVLKIIKNEDETVTFTDEMGNSIPASEDPTDKGRYTWEMPEFKEINVEISKPAITPAGIAGYVILGIVILLVISYPIIRTRSEKIQALEEKIRNSLKRKETEETEEEADEGTGEETIEETISEAQAEAGEEVPPAAEDTELEGKTSEELENLKTEMLSKLGELDKEYESGNLLDEEYDELRTSYQQKVEKITRRLEQPG